MLQAAVLQWSMSDCDLKPDYVEPPDSYPLCTRVGLSARPCGWSDNRENWDQTQRYRRTAEIRVCRGICAIKRGNEGRECGETGGAPAGHLERPGSDKMNRASVRLFRAQPCEKPLKGWRRLPINKPSTAPQDTAAENAPATVNWGDFGGGYVTIGPNAKSE